MIKVLIADDHPLVREGLVTVLAEHEDIQVEGQVGSSKDVLSFLHSTICDVVVLDINMPGRGGLDVLADIQQLYPNVHVLVLSMHPESLYGLRAIRSGAHGYLDKTCVSKELINAIRVVATGGVYVTPQLARQLAMEITAPEEKLPHQQLSNREYEVFIRIAAGKSLREIARELSLSEKTITTYRARVLEKMRASTNADLTIYSVKKGLLNQDSSG